MEKFRTGQIIARNTRAGLYFRGGRGYNGSMSTGGYPSVWTPDEYRSKPRDFDPLLADEILLRLANGDTLLTICRELRMPLPSVFRDWCEEDPRLEERHVKALYRAADAGFDVAVELSQQGDTMRARVQSEVMKWRVERMLPEKYGQRAILKQAGPDDSGGGIDHASVVRQKIEDMAARSRD